MARDHNDLQMLDRETCTELLRRHAVHVGRVAAHDGQTIVVLPVNYRVDHESVVFATNPGTKLDAVVRGEPVTFEVDEVDASWEEGWSVLVHGTPQIVEDEAERQRLFSTGLRAWVGQRSHVVRIPFEGLTGRRMV